MCGYLDEIQEVARKEFGLTEGSFIKNRKLFGRAWEQEFDSFLRAAFVDGAEYRKALTGYTTYIVDVMRQLVAFQKDGTYAPLTYEEATHKVYQNEDRMMNEYLPGHLISQFLWVHHYRHLLFFRTFFLRDMALSADQRFHDVGVGTGFYSSVILNGLPGARGHGWDLSPHSLKFTERLLSRFGTAERYTSHLSDILTAPDIEPLPFVVSVEVLEHLEDPLTFLIGLRKMVAPGGKAFITAALNSPHEDHVYHYRTELDVLDQVRAAGFHVENAFSAYAYPPTKRSPLVPSVEAVIVTT
ncbi:MAG: hypothetical protein GHCLOJNM_00354 [bacterium]|nr:hypothetical protein [bacterium]